MRKHLTPEEIQAALTTLPQWRLDNNELTRDYTFPDFLAAMVFINHVAQLAEAANHHPDIDIRYNRVRLALTTHDSGGITANDTALAAKLDLA